MKRALFALVLVILAGCEPQNAIEELPTVAVPEAARTALVLTENAPPPGFDTVAFSQINANLTSLAGWRYEMDFRFEGVFSRTPREASAQVTGLVSYNQVASAQRIVAELDLSQLRSEADARQYEAVQLGPDIFVVQEGVCSAQNTDSARAAIELDAAAVIGGVRAATTAAQQAVINGEQVWRYQFDVQDLVLPAVELGEEGRITGAVGELWVSPEHNAVIRYYLTLDVDGAIIFGSTLPVTGRAVMQYDVYDIGVVPNLSVPFGC